MNFVRVESVQGDGDNTTIFAVFELTYAEYARIISERNREAERQAQMDADMARFEEWERAEDSGSEGF